MVGAACLAGVLALQAPTPVSNDGSPLDAHSSEVAASIGAQAKAGMLLYTEL